MSLRASDPRAEYLAVRQAVGLVDRRDLGVVEVSGRDRASFLNALLSNDVKSLAPGQGCAATLLDIHGKVQVVLLVWVLEDRVLLVTPARPGADTVERLDHYLFSEKVSLADASAEWALFMLAGPEAPALAERLAGRGRRRRRGPASLPRSTAWRSGSSPGAARRASPRCGLACRLPPASALATLTAAGVHPIGPEALESLRIEAGTLRFGNDIGPAVLLPEVPFEPLLSHTKGCYPGQEVVVRIRDRGHVNRHLRGLVITGDAVPQRGDEVVAGDAVIGAVTSATRSFACGHPIALALVRRQHAEPGAAVGVRVDGRVVPATVSALPFAR